MAALLSDQIDRLVHRTRAIKAAAAEIASVDTNTRLFTHAVLYAQLGDLIRDVDSTEFGLFSLDAPSLKTTSDTKPAYVKRIDFVGATPLRRNIPRREERPQEVDPEHFAQAALKCLHRYRTIRPMPRAEAQLSEILHQLQSTRENIALLHSSLQKQQSSMVENPSKRSQLKEEEERIASLQARMEELSQRKKQLSAAKPVETLPVELPPQPLVPTSPEDRFWSTPSEASRTLKFAPNNLLDEKADFNDLSDTSFSMPTPQKEPKSAPFAHFAPMDPVLPEERIQPESPTSLQATPVELHVEIPPVKSPVLEPQSSSLGDFTESDSEQQVHTQERKAHIRITPDVERIISKMLSIYSDVLQLPRSLSTKETVARLKELSNQIPTPDSPSQSSLTADVGSHGATVQQVLIAYVLFELLSAPKHCMPFNKMKDALAIKTKSSGLSVSALGQNPTRIVYNCVAKRLLKFDRTGKEQIVKFDA